MTCKELFAAGNRGRAVLEYDTNTLHPVRSKIVFDGTYAVEDVVHAGKAMRYTYPQHFYFTAASEITTRIVDYYLEPASAAAACGTYVVPLTRDEQEEKADQVAAAQAEPPCACDLYSVLLRYGCQCGSVQRYDGGLR